MSPSRRRIDQAVAAYTALEPSLHRVTDDAVALLTDLIDEAGINYLTVSGRVTCEGWRTPYLPTTPACPRSTGSAGAPATSC